MLKKKKKECCIGSSLYFMTLRMLAWLSLLLVPGRLRGVDPKEHFLIVEKNLFILILPTVVLEKYLI